MTMSQDEWDRRQAAGDWTRLSPYASTTKPKPSRPWVDEALDMGNDVNGNGDGRHVQLIGADTITPKRVRWVWEDRIAAGTIALLAGREGLGKSTIGYWMAARVTRGELPGEYHGTPRGCLVSATEDSWAHTIVPRLMAHGADLTRVFRVEVRYDDEDFDVGLSLPKDIAGLEHVAADVNAALLILDPLMSRLSSELDAHRDGEVRRALEPLVSMTEQTGMATLGLIHHNKSGSSDPLQLVMASKAFVAVARSVHTVIPDPDDETQARRFFGTSKNNLGRLDLATLAFHIQGWEYPTDDGPGFTGQIVWGEEIRESIIDALARTTQGPEERTALDEACEWLSDYLEEHDGRALAGQLQAAGRASGHNERTIRRARTKLGVEKSKCGFQGAWEWYLPNRTKETAIPQDPPVVPLSPLPSNREERGQGDQRGQRGLSPRARGPFDTPPESHEPTRTCRCGAQATDISGLCNACLTNPGNPHTELDF